MPFAFIRVCVSKEFNEQTGNYYYGARYYDPKLSIFISVDPLAEKTKDAYGYCYQNPVRLVDPNGMSAKGPGDPPIHNEYTVDQYKHFVQKSHNITMDDNQNYILNLGCVGIVGLELFNGKDLTGFKKNQYTQMDLPEMKYSYSTLNKAIEVMKDQNASNKVDKGRAFVFAIRYHASSEDQGLPNEMGEVDMSRWTTQPKRKDDFGFDYGVYNEDTELFWHANHANNPNLLQIQ
jgi:RHS repeat-associated protein